MNAYDILGVARGCTREEVKEAFLVKVQHFHPDRGGDDTSFVELRAAYEQILNNLERFPSLVVKRPVRTSHDHRASTPPDPSVAQHSYRDLLYRVSANAAQRDPPWSSKCLNIIGIVFFLSLIVWLIFANWAAWDLDRKLREDHDLEFPRLTRGGR